VNERKHGVALPAMTEEILKQDLRGLRRRATILAWDNRRLRGLVNRIDYRLRGPMPF
jgi:hypothetical protein